MVKKHFKNITIALLSALMLIPNTSNLNVKAEVYSSKTPGYVKLLEVEESSPNKIKIVWKKTKNVTHYNIYKKKSNYKKWKKIKTVNNKTNNITYIESDDDYLYTVRGYNESSKKYGKYNTKGLKAITAPSIVEYEGSEYDSKKNIVTIKWKPARNCNLYKVYKKKLDGKFDHIATIQKRYFEDHLPYKGKGNIYIVRGYNEDADLTGGYDKKGIQIFVPK